jgi:hypothetical protein
MLAANHAGIHCPFHDSRLRESLAPSGFCFELLVSGPQGLRIAFIGRAPLPLSQVTGWRQIVANGRQANQAALVTKRVGQSFLTLGINLLLIPRYCTAFLIESRVFSCGPPRRAIQWLRIQ